MQQFEGLRGHWLKKVVQQVFVVGRLSTWTINRIDLLINHHHDQDDRDQSPRELRYYSTWLIHSSSRFLELLEDARCVIWAMHLTFDWRTPFPFPVMLLSRHAAKTQVLGWPYFVSSNACNKLIMWRRQKKCLWRAICGLGRVIDSPKNINII